MHCYKVMKEEYLAPFLRDNIPLCTSWLWTRMMCELFIRSQFRFPTTLRPSVPCLVFRFFGPRGGTEELIHESTLFVLHQLFNSRTYPEAEEEKQSCIAFSAVTYKGGASMSQKGTVWQPNSVLFSWKTGLGTLPKEMLAVSAKMQDRWWQMSSYSEDGSAIACASAWKSKRVDSEDSWEERRHRKTTSCGSSNVYPWSRGNHRTLVPPLNRSAGWC